MPLLGKAPNPFWVFSDLRNLWETRKYLGSHTERNTQTPTVTKLAPGPEPRSQQSPYHKIAVHKYSPWDRSHHKSGLFFGTSSNSPSSDFMLQELRSVLLLIAGSWSEWSVWIAFHSPTVKAIWGWHAERSYVGWLKELLSPVPPLLLSPTPVA